jgi:hypothetical protein
MPITETVTLKAAGSGLMRTIGVPLKETFNVTDVSLLRLKDGATTLPATFTVANRWNGVPSDVAKPLKWVHVTFKDTNSPRNLTVDDSGSAVPAQTNPLVVTNNTNDIVVSNGLVQAAFNKVTDSPVFLSSVQLGAEILHATDKPRLTAPVEKKTRTTWTSGNWGDEFGFAAEPGMTSVKVLNASIFSVGESVNFAYESEVTNYLPSYFGGALIQIPSLDLIPDMTTLLMDRHQIRLILDKDGANQLSPVRFFSTDGWNVVAPPPITPTVGMSLHIKEVEDEGTLTISAIDTVNNILTFTTPFTQYIPQGVDVLPTVPAISNAEFRLKAGGTIIEKQYGDKCVIIKQEGVLKDGGSVVEPTLDFVLRHYLYADTGFVRTRLTLRNLHTDPNAAECPDVFLDGLRLTFPTATSATAVSDSVLDMTTSVTRYKANNLHSTLAHSGITDFDWAIHDFNVQFPCATSVGATGCVFDIFPEGTSTKINGSLIKSWNVFWGVNASDGLFLLDSLGATFDPEYIALSKAVRPNMVEKRDWNTIFAGESQKLRDACTYYERMMATSYDITQAEPSFSSRPAMSLYEYRWDYPERAGATGSYPFGWNRWGNTPDDVGFGNNRYDLPYLLFREGLREPTLGKAELAFKLGLQQIRNRIELGQYWSNKFFNGVAGLDLKGLARYERAYAPDPFNYTNQIAPTHSWNEGTCLYWALTDDPVAKEAAYQGVLQARQYDYQGTANALLFGTGIPSMGTVSNGADGAEPRYVGWPIHTLVVGYRYFGEAVDLQRAQEYAQSFIATMANEPQPDGFIDFRSGATIQPLFQHAGYCMSGIIETWRESTGATKTALGDYIVKVAKFLQKGDQAAPGITADAPMLTGGTAHPNDPTKYNPASWIPFTWIRSFADTLAAAVTTSATTIPLTDASSFNLNLNNKRGVLIPAGQLSDPSTWEYFSYTGVSGNNLTGVTRGFSGSGAKAFNAGDIVFPTGIEATQNDVVVATLIMGARISGDVTLQQYAQKVWEDNCLYRDRIDGGNPDFVTVGNFHPVNLWPLNTGSNGLKVYGQAGNNLSEFLGDRINPPDSPVLISLSPTSVTAGAAQFTLTVNGNNFATDAEVRWGTTPLVTTFVNAGQLTAIVPASLVTTPGTAAITVVNVTVNLTSNSQTFTINAPAPTITSLFPSTKNAGEGDFVLIINGTNFASNSTATINGVSRTVTYVSPVRLDMQVLAADIATAGNKPVIVTNPTSGLSSSAVNLIVNASAGNAPNITGIAPSTAIVNVATGAITITGENLSGAAVTVDGNNVTPTSNSATQIVLPSQTFTTTGSKSIVVTTADGSDSTSVAVNNPVPVLTSIAPASVTAGAGDTTITLTGSGFVAATQARAGATSLTTTFVSSTQLTAVIASSLLTAAGTLTITVFTPTPGGGTSGGQTFTINPALNPTPVITSLSPPVIQQGAQGIVLTVNGAGFVSGAVIQIGGENRTTEFVSATQLHTTLLAEDTLQAGALVVTVENPVPGGGVSLSSQVAVANLVLVQPTLSPDIPVKRRTLRIRQGDTFSGFHDVKLDGIAVNLTGATAKMQLRSHPADDAPLVLLELSTTNGGILIDTARGRCTFSIPAATTTVLLFTRAYYDLQLTDTNGLSVTVLKGDVLIEPEFTR